MWYLIVSVWELDDVGQWFQTMESPLTSTRIEGWEKMRAGLVDSVLVDRTVFRFRF